MLALQINSMKQFMSQILAGDSFDIFLLEEAVISTANTVTIDGHLNRDFYTQDEIASGQAPAYEFTPWSSIKGLCYSLIKGKHTPLYFKFVLHLKPEFMTQLFQKETPDMDITLVKALVLTVKYDGGKAILTTGTALRTFLLSREPDRIWDKALTGYLSRKNIATELL